MANEELSFLKLYKWEEECVMSDPDLEEDQFTSTLIYQYFTRPDK